MLLISHRGNINGSLPELENNPDYIIKAINQQYDVEIDVWCIGNEYFLGHDKPRYKVPLDFLKHESLWLHLKNIEAFQNISKHKEVNWFWHETDKMVLTSKGYVIGLIGTLIPGTIINQPDNFDFLNDNLLYQGVLADNIGEIRQKLSNKNAHSRSILSSMGRTLY